MYSRRIEKRSEDTLTVNSIPVAPVICLSTEGVDHVEIRVTPVKGTKGKKCDVSFVFKSVEYPEMTSFKAVGAAAIPPEVVAEVMTTYEKSMEGKTEKKVTWETLGMMRSIVEKWSPFYLQFEAWTENVGTKIEAISCPTFELLMDSIREKWWQISLRDASTMSK